MRRLVYYSDITAIHQTYIRDVCITLLPHFELPPIDSYITKLDGTCVQFAAASFGCGENALVEGTVSPGQLLNVVEYASAILTGCLYKRGMLLPGGVETQLGEKPTCESQR